MVGAIGGLFAVDVASAIIDKDPTRLISTPRLSLLCWIVSLPIGWLIGGQLGPRLRDALRSPLAEIIGGGLGGLVPVIALGLWGWYLVTLH